MNITPSRLLKPAAVVATTLVMTLPTLGQEATTPPPIDTPNERRPPIASRDGNLPPRPSRTPAVPEPQFGVSVIGLTQLETDLKTGGGNFSKWGADALFSYRMFPTLDSSVRILARYKFSSYDWSDVPATTMGGPEPWEDINKVTLGAIISGRLDNTWSLFGGPIFEMAWESGASVKDSLSGGGLIGLTAKINDDLEFGGGVGVITELEDSVRWFPVISLDWQLSDRWSLQNQSAVSVAGTGLELVYEASAEWELAFGMIYQLNRFRLSESSTSSPDGVGQDEHWNVWFRATWAPSTRTEFNVYAGFTTGGELELVDTNKVTRDLRDYEITPSFGVSFVYRF